jgi:hypothetical protein
MNQLYIMFNKFQQLVNGLLKEMNAAGAGGAFGTPAEAAFNPPDNITSGDTIQRGDGRNIYGGIFPQSKKRKKNKKPLVIKRTLPKNTL